MTDSGIAPGYLHGYSAEEQDRLYRQARFLERSVFSSVDYSRSKNLLEVGCGVGAQTEILLERFPKLKIRGIDAAPAQIERAKKQLAKAVTEGRVTFEVGDALHLPYPDHSFDSAFICWLLEHVENPVGILKETRRKLAPGAVVYCTEVLNATFYVHPYSPCTLRYWFAFNDHQWELHGDPFVGAKLGNYLLESGFSKIETRNVTYHLDNRSPDERAQFIEYWTALLLSGAPGLLQAGRISQETVDGMKLELEALKNASDAVFFYTAIQARAEA